MPRLEKVKIAKNLTLNLWKVRVWDTSLRALNDRARGYIAFDGRGYAWKRALDWPEIRMLYYNRTWNR